MTERRVFEVCTYRDGPWWMVAIPEIDGLTNARFEGEVELTASEYIELSQDIPPESFEVRLLADDGPAVVGGMKRLADLRDSEDGNPEIPPKSR